MPTPDALWQRALADIQMTLSTPVFKTWFARTKCLDLTDSQVLISCPNKMVMDQLDAKYYKIIQQTLTQLLGYEVDLRFAVEKPNQSDTASPLFDQIPDSTEPGLPAATTSAVPSQPAQRTYSSNTSVNPLNPHYTFDNFVVGATNRVAHAAALAITDRPGQSYNPFFLYGGTGVGKTHLVQAIGNALLAKQASINILYCSSERFTNDFIDSIRFKTTNEFKKKYRSVDVLIVDDIQFIGTGNKESTQEEFFHTFNELHTSGRQIILCSDRPPHEIASLADRLTSRFEGGLTVDINPPDFETRSAIIRTKADQLHLELSSEIADYIASLAPENIRALEGMILKLQSVALTLGQPLTLGTVQSVLGQATTAAPANRRPNPNELLKLICETYGITLKDLLSKKRTANLVAPRQLSMYLLRQDIGLNLESIGQLLGGRDHTTIMHGIDKISKLATSDEQTRTAINAIRQVALK